MDFIIGIKFIKIKYGYIIHQYQYLNKILENFEIENIMKYQVWFSFKIRN